MIEASDVDQSTSYAVIVHKSNPVTSLSKNEVSQMLLKKMSRWEHGTSVDPVDLESNSSVRESFSKDVHGRSVSSINNYWQRQILAGRSTPPVEVSSDADVVAYVRSHPGAIGYVSSVADVKDVKVINIID